MSGNKTYVPAKVSAKQLSKVENNILNADQLGFLFAKTPERFKYERPAKGGGKWTYVTGEYVKKTLNMMFGWNWDFVIVDKIINIDAKQCIIQGRLKCRSGGVEIVKDQWGRADIKFRKGTAVPLDLGNDLKAATTDALKKCASEMGIASDVYGSETFREVIIDTEKTDEKKEKARVIDFITKEAQSITQLTEVLETLESYPDLRVLYDVKYEELEAKEETINSQKREG